MDVPEAGTAAFGGPEPGEESTRTVTRALPPSKPKGRAPWVARMGGALLLASLVVLCGPIGGVFSLLSSSSSALEEMAVLRGAALAEGLGHRNARALADHKELELDLSPAEGDPAIKDALLVDTRGDVLAPSTRTKESLKGNPIFARAIELRDTTWGEDDGQIGIIAPVRAEAVAGGPSRSVVGYAYLRYDASGAAAAVGRPWLRGLVSLLLVFGAAAGVFAAIWRLAVKPIVTVREETELAIRGHIERVEAPARWTQLEELAHTINRALERAHGKAPAADPKLETLVAATTTPVFVLDDAARVTSTNELAARWLGAPVEQLVGRPLPELVPDAAARDTLSGMLRALGEGQGPTHAAPLHVSGHALTVSVTGQSAAGRLRFAVVVIS
ncbi:MAG: PAS domain-containing protein [Alphaproteobacteria bacterium]|nr:PAS domain-containing protein [Alphaproteobacteria bacterium]